MSGRVILAAIVGGIAMFFWGFLSHTVLGLGEYGISALSNDQAVIESVQTATGGKDGLYVAPSAMPETATSGPTLFLVYRHEMKMGPDMSAMLPQMGGELAIDIVESFILAGLLSLTLLGFMGKVGWAAAAGLMSGLATLGSYHIWYGFPAEYTAASLIDEVICFLLAGIVIALILPRRAVAA